MTAMASTRQPPDPTAAAFLPGKRSLRALQEAAKARRGRPLWERATQTFLVTSGPPLYDLRAEAGLKCTWRLGSW